MTISIRDERGQAVLEYLLTLIIAVAIIFGGLYQLNSAFKGWAANYFGDYLACLLETGELPSISGTGGDPGSCNRLFKPFSIAEGRQLAAVGASAGQTSTIGNPVAASERGGGGGGGGYGGTPFAGGRTPIKPNGGGNGPGRSKISPTNTGSTEISNYGTPYTSRGQTRRPDRVKIDRGSLIDDQREATQRPSSTTAKVSADQSGSKMTKIRAPTKRNVAGEENDKPFSFGDFLRYLIIAAIIIALLMFLGGQALQIGKSMD